MGEFTARTEGIAAFGTTTATMAAQMQAAGAEVTAAGPAQLGPVFGLVGADFVTAFATAHAAHTRVIARLSDALDAMSTTAAATAAAYDATDHATADALSSTGTRP